MGSVRGIGWLLSAPSLLGSLPDEICDNCPTGYDFFHLFVYFCSVSCFVWNILSFYDGHGRGGFETKKFEHTPIKVAKNTGITA